MSAKKFPILKPGQTVALVCTGTPVAIDVANRSQQYLLDNYQLVCVYQSDTYAKLPASARAEIFMGYLFDDQIKAIWALRGGEGTADLIPFIEQHRAKISQLSPKLLIGFSDFTALLIYFAQQFSWPVVHGSGIPQFLNRHVDINSEQALAKLIFGESKQARLTGLIPLNKLAEIDDEITGVINGGNLSLINISVKESWELNGSHRILLIEDVREKPHAVTRTLKHLSRIDMFAKAQAIIFGDFTCVPIGETESEQQKNKEALITVLKTFADGCNFPVLLTDQVGHGKVNLPIVFNEPAKLKLGQTSELVIKL